MRQTVEVASFESVPLLGEITRLVGGDAGPWLEVLDLPLWCLAATFSFRISAAFRGGTLGRAASWVAWALVVVAVGKTTRAIVLLLDEDGAWTTGLVEVGGGLVLLVAWVLAGLGIYEFYRAGRSI